jgi:hypothetical protein
MIIMLNLLDYIGQAVQLDVHATKDKQFKKPLLSTSVILSLDAEPSPLLGKINAWGKKFKINLEESDTTPLNAEAQLLTQFASLNSVLSEFSTEEFILFVVSRIDTSLQNIKKQIRDENGNLRPPHLHKEYFANAIEAYLLSKGFNAKCNMNKGTLYIDDVVIINSGITQSTRLSDGLFKVLGLFSDKLTINQYAAQYYKSPCGTFQPGSWANQTGDEVYIHGFSLILLESTIHFIERMTALLDIDISGHSTFSTVLNNAKLKQSDHQTSLSSLFAKKVISRETMLGIKLISDSEAYNQLKLLNLGEPAIDAFCEMECGKLLLDNIKHSLGASRVRIFNPLEEHEKEQHHGYYDEFYNGHVPLPAPKVRKAMLVLKEELEDPNSLISICFDKKKLKLNVTATASYNHQTDETNSAYEFLEVCMGTVNPIACNEQVVCFTFDL